MDTIFIPGGTGALGSIVTKRLLNDGYACIVPYRNPVEAQRLRTSVDMKEPDQLILIQADLMEKEEAVKAFQITKERGGIYALVHLMGGIRGFQPIGETSPEDWEYLMRLNLDAFFYCARLAMEHFNTTLRGRIVSISAMGGVKPSAKQAGYGVSKAGVIALTKILADEGRSIGVTANSIAPGIIDTPANRAWGKEEDFANWVKPEAIAEKISFLLSLEAATVNGSVIEMSEKL